MAYLPKIGQTLWYVATYEDQWIALLTFSAAAWKCAVRDQWIGWDFHHQYDYDRLKLIANNSRFLILPNWHYRNLGSKILSLCQKRLCTDWQKHFGHRLLLLETFVDPQRFVGTVYAAANWIYLGLTRGYRRTRQGYSNAALSPKKVFVKPLQHHARTVLCAPVLSCPYRQGVVKMKLNAQQMLSLPDFLCRHPRSTPRPGTTPLAGVRLGHCLWRHPLWHARLQGHGRLGSESLAQSPPEISLPACQCQLHRP